MITTSEVKEVIHNGEIIEDYPSDPRGHSCLMLYINDRALHVVCAPKAEYLMIVTAYVPSVDQWMPDFKTRRK